MNTDYQFHTESATDLLLQAAEAEQGSSLERYSLAAAQVYATLAEAAATFSAAAPAMVQAAAQLDGVALKAQERIQELRQSDHTSEAKTSRICGMDEVAGIAREQARYLRHIAGVTSEGAK